MNVGVYSKSRTTDALDPEDPENLQDPQDPDVSDPPQKPMDPSKRVWVWQKEVVDKGPMFLLTPS